MARTRPASPSASCPSTTATGRWARVASRPSPGSSASRGEGLCVGRDSGAPVTDDYPGESPYRFTGGIIKRVRVNVSGEPYLNLEREAVAMLMRE